MAISTIQQSQSSPMGRGPYSTEESIWGDEDNVSSEGQQRVKRLDFLQAASIRKFDVLNLTTQLSVMLGTGISISQSLEAIIDQCTNQSMRKVLQDIKACLQGGEDLSLALARYPRLFDNTYISMVEAAEQTGRLPETLTQIAGYMEKKQIYASKIKSAMAYPMVILILTIGVTVFLLTNILPKFKPLFEREGNSLPAITSALISLSNVLLGYWGWWLVGLLAVAGLFCYWKTTELGRRQWDWFLIQAPVIGPLVRKITLSRSILTLGVMLNCGVSVLQAITLTSKVAGNTHYRKVWNAVRDRVSSGDRIVTALKGEKLFPSTLVQMMNAGEESGKLDEVLEKVSQYYDREVDTQIKTMSTVVEPLLIVVMGSIVGTIGMAIMLPIFSLSQQV